MGKLTLITGLGHCGTTWAVHVLNRPHKGVFAIHAGMAEWYTPKRGVGPGNRWKVQTNRYVNAGRVDEQEFKYYFEHIRSLLRRHNHVVDSQSWLPLALKDVCGIVKVERVIWLIRHGFVQVNSLSKTQHAGSNRFWFKSIIEAEAQYFGWEAPQTDKEIEWEYWCRWWAAQRQEIDTLRNAGINVSVLKLEDLTTKVGALNEFAELFGLHFTHREARMLQAEDVNRHLQIDRRPKVLYKRSTYAERTIFDRCCKQAMRSWGYR